MWSSPGVRGRLIKRFTVRAIAPVALTTSPVPTWYAAWVAFPTSFTNQVWYGARRPAVGRGSLVATKMSAMTPNAFTPSDRKFLAGIVHQVWRARPAFASVGLRRSPRPAPPGLAEVPKATGGPPPQSGSEH